MLEITPRTNDKLFGHEDAEAQFLHNFSAGKLAHGWIISGQRGIGKATLAYRFARAILTSPSPHGGEGRGGGDFFTNQGNTPSLTLPPNGGGNINSRIIANSHSDLLVIEPAYDEKKEEYAREITVEQAREIAKFLSLTPGEGQWRVVIVDSADALNVNAANAILKILEEPPNQSVILLASHNPGKLLQTIRSRCRNLKLKPLDTEQFNAAMHLVAPDVDEYELSILAALSANSPGIALDMHKQGAAEIYDQILELLSSLPDLDTVKLYAFAERMTAGQVHASWQLLTQLMLCLFDRIARQATGVAFQPVSAVEAAVLKKSASLHPASVWAMKWRQCADQFSLAETRHLDYKQVILTFFHSIANREGFQIGNAAA